ncbi:MAG: prolyl oligopeptidase family serine peptidase [Eubacteriales bacterium]
MSVKSTLSGKINHDENTRNLHNSNSKRLLHFDDLNRIEYLSFPDLSPDGKHALYVVNTSCKETGGFVSHIYEVPTSGGGTPRQLAANEGSYEDMPQYSPDGKLIAFRSNRSGQYQLWLYDRENGVVRQLTSLRHGIGNFAWSPDGTRIAFEASYWPGEEHEVFSPMTPEEKKCWQKKRENSPIVVEDLIYKLDEAYGMLDGSIKQIGVVCISNSSVTMLTSGSMQCSLPAWSPDGKNVAFYGFPDGGEKALRAQVYVSAADASTLKKLTDEPYIISDSPVVYTPDGHNIVYLGYNIENGIVTRMPFRYSLLSGKAECIFPKEAPCCGIDYTPVGRTAYGSTTPLIKRTDDNLYFLSIWHGSAHIYTLSLDKGSKVNTLTSGKIAIHDFSAPKNGMVAYIRGDYTTIAELYVLDIETGKEKRLTFSNRWLDGVQLSIPQEMWVDSKDGKARIHGWIMPPTRREDQAKHPAVLNIHGGPEASYTYDFWFELQMLAASGMAVVYCNPRGSSGYGSPYQTDTYGDDPMDDLLAFLDAAIELGYIDENKVGVTGGSYGGLMTNKMISLTNRFKAAVTQRTLCNLTTSYGTGDIGFVRNDKNFKSMLNMLLSRARSRSSTIRYIDNVKIPLLILHGTNDYRCSFEQAEQFFIAMKDRNPDVPVRLVAFPGENHNISRGGKLHFQIAHLREMTLWFKKYLNTEVAVDAKDSK